MTFNENAEWFTWGLFLVGCSSGRCLLLYRQQDTPMDTPFLALCVLCTVCVFEIVYFRCGCPQMTVCVCVCYTIRRGCSRSGYDWSSCVMDKLFSLFDQFYLFLKQFDKKCASLTFNCRFLCCKKTETLLRSLFKLWRWLIFDRWGCANKCWTFSYALNHSTVALVHILPNHVLKQPSIFFYLFEYNSINLTLVSYGVWEDVSIMSQTVFRFVLQNTQ